MYAETKKRLDEEIQLRLVSAGFEVIIFFMLNSTEHEIASAHKN